MYGLNLLAGFWRSERFALWIRHLEHMRPKFFYPGESWVFCRTACLGSDVLKLAFPTITSGQRFHLQKVRIDSLLGHLLFTRELKPTRVSLKVRKWFLRDDVWGLADQQNSRLVARNSPPLFCLMDSYSELTDQKFAIGNSSNFFYSNYSDVSQEALRSGRLRAEGLLDLTDVAQYFEDFITAIGRQWGSIPIVLMTYPPDLESRDHFLVRSARIEELFRYLERKHENIFLVERPVAPIEADPMELAEGRVFPYHYALAVKEELARNLRRVLRSTNIQMSVQPR